MVISMKLLCWGYNEKNHPGEVISRDMKTGSRLNRAFFVHITPKWGIFLYIYDNTHVQTHKNKLSTFDLA